MPHGLQDPALQQVCVIPLCLSRGGFCLSSFLRALQNPASVVIFHSSLYKISLHFPCFNLNSQCQKTKEKEKREKGKKKVQLWCVIKKILPAV
jgi:hypothetical protein